MTNTSKNLTIQLDNLSLIQVTANQEQLNLLPEHYLIIKLLQDFYKEFNLPPSTRALINYVKQHNPELKLDSLLFAKYFPKGISQACLIAQIPASPTCL
jgi:tRNA 2-thiouridine synthesizing protein E